MPAPETPAPEHGHEHGPARDPRRARTTGLLLLGVAVVLLASSVTWFTTGREIVGIAQLVMGAVSAAAGGALYRRATRS